jgi:hypothetical protein
MIINDRTTTYGQPVKPDHYFWVRVEADADEIARVLTALVRSGVEAFSVDRYLSGEYEIVVSPEDQPKLDEALRAVSEGYGAAR